MQLAIKAMTVFATLVCVSPMGHVSAQSSGPNAAEGAWWDKGGPPSDAVPDLTGLWQGRTSGDLSDSTLPGQELILTPYGYARYASVDHSKDPNGFCLPPGPARMFMMAHPALIVQRPDVVAILQESQRTFRLIYTDGRDHPEDVADYPEFMGSSIGHWEGETLVVETIGVDDRVWLDTSGHEASDQLHLTERFRLVGDGNTLEHVVTYTDAMFFERPWTTRRTFERQIGGRILNHSCSENEQALEHALPLIGGEGLDRAITLEHVEDGNE